jgi:hypothetical protein
MEENVTTRTRLLLSAAAVGLMLTSASAQTRDEQPRSGSQIRSQDTRPQGSQVERIQEPSRQRAEPQSQNQPPAQSNAQAQPPGQQQQPQQSQPQQQGAPSTAPARQSTGNQPPAQTGQAPAASAPQNPQPSAAQQPAQPRPGTTAQQPAQNQPGAAAQQPAQTQRPAQSQQQTGRSQPAQNNAAPGAQQRASGVVSLSTQQQTEVGRTIARHNVRPLTNVNFSISIGTRVPRSVSLRALPGDLVTYVPQYRGYSYFVVEEQIVIVEPSSLEIVTIVPYSSSKTTSKASSSGKAMSNQSVKLSTEQRNVVRKHATERKASTDRTTTTVRKRYQPGDQVDREVTIETFPETIYTEVPSIRRYRYFRNDDDVLLVDPDEDRVVDVIR